MGYKETYEAWLANPYFDEATKDELKPIGKPFTGSRRNPRSRKRGERNGSTKGTPADRGTFRHAR